jgi:hypothetical protein
MPTDLLQILRRRGPMSGGDLVRQLGSSRPTLMRSVRSAGDDVVVRGRARATTYAARRPLRGSVAPLPLYRVDRAGDLHRIASIDLVAPAGCAVDAPQALGWPLDGTMAAGWFTGLPYPLHDMRPQGFLGRQFARAQAAMLQVAPDPTRWSDDDTLHALSLMGADTPGDLIVGDTAARWWLQRREAPPGEPHGAPIDDDEVHEVWPRLAAQAMAAGVPGSSAGGEFPKFTALRRRGVDPAPQHVLVKFSGSDNAPGTRRWSDLLVCEHLAAGVMHEHLGVRATRSRVVEAGGRTFLEVDRFDRHGRHGRSPVASWMAIDADLVGAGGHPWPDATRALTRHGWLPASDAERILRLWLFGRLIANTDMHDGNLAFEPTSTPGGPGLTLAPAYDMLPMLYAPVRGVELPEPPWTPPWPLPHERDAWAVAAAAAEVFWGQVAADTRVSAGFRRTAADHEARVRTARG